MTDKLVRFAIPSKGRMESETLEFFEKCGFKLKRNGRQYIAKLEGISQIQIIFQRQSDIVRGVESGNHTFGIAGLDLVEEITDKSRKDIVIIHNNLGFGFCRLEVAIPETWPVRSIQELSNYTSNQKFRVGTKFPNLTKSFLNHYSINSELVDSAGTIEVTPALGYTDFIVDLVTTGQTLNDNRLKQIESGNILTSYANFIGNRNSLKNPDILALAKIFLEYFEGTLRGRQFVSIHANIKGENPQKIAEELFTIKELKGLTGPTISPVFSQDKQSWFSVHIAVEKRQLTEAITGLRKAGGSGLVVTPALYIFEEEPEQYLRLLKSLEA